MLATIVKRHEKVVFAPGVGARPDDAVYEPAAFCRTRVRYHGEQQQSAALHNPGTVHRLQTREMNTHISDESVIVLTFVRCIPMIVDTRRN